MKSQLLASNMARKVAREERAKEKSWQCLPDGKISVFWTKVGLYDFKACINVFDFVSLASLDTSHRSMLA